MANLQKVLSPIYATIDYDLIELRPCFTLSSSLSSLSSSSNVSTMTKEDTSISLSNTSFQSEPYFDDDDDDRKFKVPRVICTSDYYYTNNDSLWPYWESIKAENMTYYETFDEKNVDICYFDDNELWINTPSHEHEEDEPFVYF